MDLDLFRLHVLDGALASVPPKVREAWTLSKADVSQLAQWAGRARGMLVRRGLITAR